MPLIERVLQNLAAPTIQPGEAGRPHHHGLHPFQPQPEFTRRRGKTLVVSLASAAATYLTSGCSTITADYHVTADTTQQGQPGPVTVSLAAAVSPGCQQAAGQVTHTQNIAVTSATKAAGATTTSTHLRTSTGPPDEEPLLTAAAALLLFG